MCVCCDGMYVCMSICIYIYVCVYVNECMCVCVCVCEHMYVFPFTGREFFLHPFFGLGMEFMFLKTLFIGCFRRLVMCGVQDGLPT